MGLNEVFKKVADIERNATELASHKVDLATPDDLEKQKIKAAKELENAAAASKKAIQAIDIVFTAYRQNAILSNEGLTMAADVEKKFKELNFPAPSYVAAWTKELNANVKNSQAKMKALQAAKNSIS